jgi:hypothetical protein
MLALMLVAAHLHAADVAQPARYRRRGRGRVVTVAPPPQPPPPPAAPQEATIHTSKVCVNDPGHVFNERWSAQFQGRLNDDECRYRGDGAPKPK